MSSTKMTLPYLTELTALVSEPKTLRCMKNTNWARHNSRDVHVGYRYCLRIKAKDLYELEQVMDKWQQWGEKGQLDNICKNPDGDIIFCEKSDIYHHSNYSITTDIRNAERLLREKIEQLEFRIKRENNSLANIAGHSQSYCLATNKEKMIEIKKKEDEESRNIILKSEAELPSAIAKYDSKNEELAKTLGYPYIPYEKSIGIERSKNGDLVLGRKHFEKAFTEELEATFDKTREGCYQKVAWEHKFDKGIMYGYLPPDKDYYFENGECFIKISYNLKIRQEVYLKKGQTLPLREPKDNLYTPEMFNVSKKFMKCWNTQNVDEADRTIEQKNQGAFVPYEECGVECFYVRLGYAKDGKKMPNNNRGTLESLKCAWRENIGEAISKADKAKAKKEGKPIKMPTKKDDLIKQLMKL